MKMGIQLSKIYGVQQKQFKGSSQPHALGQAYQEAKREYPNKIITEREEIMTHSKKIMRILWTVTCQQTEWPKRNVHISRNIQPAKRLSQKETDNLNRLIIIIISETDSVKQTNKNMACKQKFRSVVVKTLCFHWGGMGSIPGPGTKIPHKAKKKESVYF